MIQAVVPQDFWWKQESICGLIRKDEIFYDKQKKRSFYESYVYGYDMDRTMLRIGAMNMMNHRVESPFIRIQR